MYGKQYKGKKELTNAEYIQKKRNKISDEPRTLYPSYDDEVKGIFDLTTIKKKGKHSRMV